MQFIAMLTMLIDHVGILYFPEDMLWRVVGRIAFPLYAYALVQGFRHTSNYGKYARRLFIIAAVSQIPYQLAFHTNGLNIVATLFISALLFKVLDDVKPGIWTFILLSGVCLLVEVFPFDYGAYGLLLVLIYKYGKSSEMVVMHVVLNVIYLFAYQWHIQMFSIIPTLIIVYGPKVWKYIEAWRMPGWIWRSFYPLHLLILAITVYYMKG